jgi:hypothetical protein
MFVLSVLVSKLASWVLYYIFAHVLSLRYLVVIELHSWNVISINNRGDREQLLKLRSSHIFHLQQQLQKDHVFFVKKNAVGFQSLQCWLCSNTVYRDVTSCILSKCYNISEASLLTKIRESRFFWNLDKLSPNFLLHILEDILDSSSFLHRIYCDPLMDTVIAFSLRVALL